MYLRYLAIVVTLLLSRNECHASEFNYFDARQSVVTVFCIEGKSFGGGVAISRNNIISMQHVVGSCKQVLMGYTDGTVTIGSVIATDNTHDLVQIQPDIAPPAYAQLEVSTPHIGEQLHLIAHPNGMAWSYSPANLAYPEERRMTVGERSLDILEVNTVWFAGFSGGALFNDSGHVIGFGEGGLTNTSLAFFVPSSAACKRLVKCRVK